MNKDDKSKEFKTSFSDDELKKILNNKQGEAEEIISDKNKTKEFVDKVVEKLGNIPIIGPFFEDVPLMCSLVYDYVTGMYKEIPLASIITIVAALVYFINPIDLIPDPIPIIGHVDDIAVIGFSIMAVHNDLQSYKVWKADSK